ncbi:MAG: zinc ABC transporter substrate-binding protein, partial [Clostridia bacterium]|nr:zinc ABC transporter substrate-binding protein [Clostridia bacterium]
EDHDHEEDDEHEEEGEHEEEEEFDEHVWLSLRNAKTICEYLAGQLSIMDPDGSDTYSSNLTDYSAKLEALDGEYKSAVGSAEKDTLVFADRFPFRYMVDDYGLDYYAAFVGCSTDSEASFETVVFLANKLDELELDHVIVIEGTDHKIADSVISSSQNKDRDILVLDSMQGITKAGSENEFSYISIMESNLEVLRSALN